MRFEAAGMKPEEIINARKEIAALRNSLVEIRQTNALLQSEIRRLEPQPEGAPVLLPDGLQARVITADRTWNFVVLDAGSEQGMLKNAELLLARGNTLIGKVKITSVQKNQSVANLVQGWQVGAVTEGDLAIPAHPKS
jgi:cell shape-determining protein MreC